jgi:zinc protease
MSSVKAKKLNRKTPPPIRSVETLHLPPPDVHTLDDGIRVYDTRMGTQDVLKLDISFAASRPHEHCRIAARAAVRQLREGTRNHSSRELSEWFDFYAGTVQSPISFDHSGLRLYCLTKHFDALLPMIAEMLYEPAYSMSELAVFTENNIQSLQVELTKADTIAYREISESFFGAAHPYGYNSTEADYRLLKPGDLMRFHKDWLTTERCQIFLAGKTDDTIVQKVNQYLGQTHSTSTGSIPPLPLVTDRPTKKRLHQPDTMQTAIRIGRRLFTRQHPDYAGFFVLNTILGGYFGSRLMSNIREEKGYTYNIYSTTDHMHFDGSFYIGTEVGNDVAKDTLHQIYHELNRLCTEPIEEEELTMVRNYLLGNMLNMVDGAFPVSDTVKSLVSEGLPLAQVDVLVQTIKTITADELQQLAQRYLRADDLYEVVVGK